MSARAITTQRTIPIRFLRAANSAAVSRGIDLAECVRQLNLDPALLYDDRARITLDQATRLVQELWKITGDELVGLGVQPAPRGSFRLICLGVITSPDLGTVLARLVDFSNVLPSLPRFTVDQSPTTTRVTFHFDSEYDPAHLMTDTVLAVILRFFGWLVGQRLPIEAVELPYPLPDGAEDYDLVFGSHVRFERPAPMIAFGNEMLKLPLVQDETSMEKWLRDSPADLLMLRDYGVTVADQVRRILERGLHGTWPSLDEVAAQLSMSTQNLRRRLRKEGTSATRIKEDLLRDAAVTALVRADESVAQLAERLGFSEPSAFHRAFRRWTGSSPGAYRPNDELS
jgi:AraC-like DNA-binding protein